MNGQASRRVFRVADTQHGWIGRLPQGWHDYALLARLDRPIGTWLLLLPCWWGLALPLDGVTLSARLWYAALMTFGAFVMRGAGCTLNDLADRDFDAKVARTRDRPLAAGRVGVRGALAFLGLQLGLGLLVVLALPPAAGIVAVCSLPLVAIYPFAKRFTWWPQVFLGLAFNWGALVGAAAVTGTVAPAFLLLYAAGIAWTLGYDTVYAHQDKEDDALIGVRSTARLFGATTPRWLIGFYALTLALLWLAMALAGHGTFGFVALALPAVLLWQNVRGLDTEDSADCIRRFRAHRNIGLAVLLALLLGHLPF